jgi:catechol 2,3-dioxygenase-like lactoylglutathione lyase family enzyme
MDEKIVRLLEDYDRERMSRRHLLYTLGVAGVGAAAFGFGGTTANAQGRCMRGYGTAGCPLDEKTATAPIKPVFEPTGWNTVSLDHIAFQVADYKIEAAFYIALMGWKLRSDDGTQAVLDLGNWGTVIFRQRPPAAAAEAGAAPAGGGRGRGGGNATVESFCFDITPWNAKSVEAELKKRGLTPVADNDGKGFESFRVKDPDGFNLQIGNGNGYTRARRTLPATATLAQAAPFESTGWKTVWLDHFSFNVTNYKESASFYMNLLGWKPTYDEGSQHELMIGEVGDVIIRGGNPFDPNFGRGGARGARGQASGEAGAPPAAAAQAPALPVPRSARIDHISFGIEPWDTDGVKAELEKRGLRASVDTSTGDDIHVAAFKSYHTATPNGYNLQISYVTHDNRLALPNAVKPKTSGGR